MNRKIKTALKILLSLTILTTVFFSVCSKTWASEEFSTSTIFTYNLKSDGIVNVTQELSLTNKLSDVYATSYSISIGSLKLKNIRAWDNTGALDMKVDRSGDRTQIDLWFNDEVVGKGKTQHFWISYEMSDLARKAGRIWEINLPKIGNVESFDGLTAQLKVPLSLGNPAYIVPEPQKKEKKDGKYVFYFSKEQISNAGVIAAFGQFQIFGFKLSYHLENLESKPIKTEVAVPPDTNYQRVILKKIEPEPIDVRIDEDGNWLAEYILNPNERKDISAEGKVQIFAEARNVQKRPMDTKALTAANKYWEVDSPEVQKFVSQFRNVRDAYSFVVGLLDYDYLRTDKKIERFGAQKALQEPKGSLCMEFTDLLVTFLRAKGVPAREVIGYAYTTNSKLRPLSAAKDVLHSWAEYYDKNQDRWVQVDPTWENTTKGVDYFSKLDMNHFAFVIHGRSSEFPVTPGSYKIKDEEKKDVEVYFDNLEKEELEGKIALDFSLPKYLFSFITTPGLIKIKNDGWTAEYDVIGKIKTERIDLKGPVTLNLGTLPPFTKRELVLKLENNRPFFFGKGKVVVEVLSEEFSHEITVVPIIFVFLASFTGGFIVWFLLRRLAPKAREMLFSRQRKL